MLHVDKITLSSKACGMRRNCISVNEGFRKWGDILS